MQKPIAIVVGFKTTAEQTAKEMLKTIQQYAYHARDGLEERK